MKQQFQRCFFVGNPPRGPFGCLGGGSLPIKFLLYAWLVERVLCRALYSMAGGKGSLPSLVGCEKDALCGPALQHFASPRPSGIPKASTSGNQLERQ